MKPAYSQHPISYPTSWSELAYGDWAREKIQAQLDEWLPRLFGYHLLKLGGLSCELMSQNCHITHQVAIDRANTNRTISAENSALPFVDKAFDVCLVANQLDYTKAAHHLLQEIDRVTIDDGYLIISGFNPFGLLGLGRFMPGNRAHFPWNGRMFTSARVQDWLSVLSYQVIDARSFGLFPVKKYSLLSENI
ncbi:MAG: methyltransferase domain-containing protein, partial [Enterovibrio sp.]